MPILDVTNHFSATRNALIKCSQLLVELYSDLGLQLTLENTEHREELESAILLNLDVKLRHLIGIQKEPNVFCRIDDGAERIEGFWTQITGGNLYWEKAPQEMILNRKECLRFDSFYDWDFRVPRLFQFVRMDIWVEHELSPSKWLILPFEHVRFFCSC